MREQKHFLDADSEDEAQKDYDSVRRDEVGDMPPPNEWADQKILKKPKKTASDKNNFGKR